MRKLCLLVLSTFLSFSVYAQWDQSGNLVYTLNNIVTIGANNVQGNFSSNTRAVEVVSNEASYLNLKAGSKSLQLGRTTNFGNNLYIPSNENFSFAYGASKVMTIDPNLSVGIGIDTPGYKLEVNGDVGVQTELTWGTEEESKLLDDEGGSIRLAGNNVNNTPYIEFYNKYDGGVHDARIILNSDDALSVESTQVGIGTIDFNSENADSRLIVDGKILCEEVQVVLDVDDAVPDYVFQKYYTGSSALKADYVMPTLEEVEAFTKANHHLPEVPSAAEIKDEGLELKEMTTILLQKIEELTLYTIEQEKRIKTLEAQLAKKQ